MRICMEARVEWVEWVEWVKWVECEMSQEVAAAMVCVLTMMVRDGDKVRQL